jgi:DNA-binding HxlR family transcriptional regulator
MSSTNEAATSSTGLSGKMQRGELFAVACPSREILRHVTSQWGVLVLVALLEGTYRFSDLRRKVGGVSEKMLAQTLQALESDGFVIRTSFPVVPPHVEYHLSTMGQDVALQVGKLADWIEDNLPGIMAQRESKEAHAASEHNPSVIRHHL